MDVKNGVKKEKKNSYEFILNLGNGEAFDKTVRFYLAPKNVREQFIREAGEENEDALPILKSMNKRLNRLKASNVINQIITFPFRLTGTVISLAGTIVVLPFAAGLAGSIALASSNNIRAKIAGVPLTAIAGLATYGVTIPIDIATKVVLAPAKIGDAVIKSKTAKKLCQDTSNMYSVMALAPESLEKFKSQTIGVEDLEELTM